MHQLVILGFVVICYSDGWVDIWTTPKASVNIGYKYHAIPPSGRDMDEFPGTPDGEETILIPVLVAQRPLRPRTQGRDSSGYPGLKEFDPTVMEPDNIDVKIDIGASVCYAYGSLVCHFLNLKVLYPTNLWYNLSVLHLYLIYISATLHALFFICITFMLFWLITNCS